MPGAWELIKTSRNSVLVGIIKPPDLKVTLAWAQAYRDLQMPPGSALAPVQGLPFGPARNQLVKTTLDNGFGYCFMLDADVCPPPDVILRLIASGHDLIGALYYQRFPTGGEHVPAAATIATQKDAQGNLTQGRGPLPPHKPGETIPVDFLPAGATLYSRRLLETIIARYPRPFEWQLDIDRNAGLSEDFDLCLKAHSVGFVSWLDTSLVCGHETQGIVRSPHGLEALG